MGTIQRPVKTGGTREYVTERAAGYITIRSAEMDADLDTIYSAWNAGLLPYPAGSIPGSAIADLGITTAKLADGSVTDPKIVSMSYAKLIGAPSSLPPGGVAGGDLSGTYPNPTLTPVAKSKWTDSGTYLQPVAGALYPIRVGPTSIAINTPGGPAIQITSADPSPFPLITLIRTDAMHAGDVLGSISYYGNDTTANMRGGSVTMRAGEVWSASAHGTNYEVSGTPLGSTVPESRLVMNGNRYNYMPGTIGLRIGDVTTPREMLDVVGAVVLAGSTAGAPVDGTIQFTGTAFQGRVGGAWVGIGSQWTDSGTYLQPVAGAQYPVRVGPLTVRYDGAGANVQIYTMDPANSPIVTMIHRQSTADFTGVAASSLLGTLAYYASDGSTDTRGGQLVMRTAEAWTPTAHGTTYEISTMLLGSSTLTQRLAIKASGVTVMPGTNGLRIGDATDPRERLDVLGAVILGGSTAGAPVDGTIQYTGTKIQGRVGGAWVDIIPGSGGPPSGAIASGDLAGSSYPNPVVAPLAIATGKLAALAVTDAKVNDVAWSKITGTPATFPAGGTAGGDLSGSYPNPTVVKAAGAFTANGAITALGSQDQLVWGTRTIKGRLSAAAGLDYFEINTNVNLASVQDDVSKSSWRLRLRPDSDRFEVLRHAPGGAAVAMLTVDSAGNLTTAAACIVGTNLNLAGGTLTASFGNVPVVWGNGTVKGRLINGTAVKSIEVTANANNGGTQDDATVPSWRLMLDTSTDLAKFNHQPLGSTTVTTVASVDGSGNLIILGANATKNTGTVWINPSDPRLKRDMASYETGLDAITRLAPITFCYNGLGGTVDDGRMCYGLDASVVQDVMPECVGTRTGKLHPDDEEESEMLTLDASNITWALINAVKELAARVATLEAA